MVRTIHEIEEVYTRWHVMVYQVCLLYMRNRADAEDCAQDTFFRLMRYNPVFESEEHEKAWLLRTAINVSKNALRSRKHQVPQPAEEILLSNNDGGRGNTAFEEPGREEALLCLFSLPPKYRAALYLHYYEGYSAAEIGRMLGGRESTARSWLLRGRNLLKLEIEKEEHQ